MTVREAFRRMGAEDWDRIGAAARNPADRAAE
jgi:hypothetical protein